MRKHKGISPVVSVIILIAIATVGGGMVFAVQNQYMSAGLNKMDLRVSDLRLEKDVTGACYLYASIHNSGTESINDLHLRTTLDTGEDFERQINNFGTEFIPGNSTDYFLNPTLIDKNDCGNFTLSQTYTIRINASSNDSTFATIKNVKVTNVTMS